MNEPGKSELLNDKAYRALVAAFRGGALRHGQFVSMGQLVELLGFPISPVREAVKQAGAQGFVATVPKRGVQVMEASPHNIRESLDVRMALDQEGARRRIATGKLDGLEALRRRHEEMQDAARTDTTGDLPPEAIRVDLSLHDYLAEGLGNSLLSAAYETNRVRIAIIQNARPFLHDRIVSAMDEHLAIIDALQARDAGTATAALKRHCEQTLRWWGVP